MGPGHFKTGFALSYLKFDWDRSHKRPERRISVPLPKNARNRIWVKISSAKMKGCTCFTLHEFTLCIKISKMEMGEERQICHD